MPLLKLYQKAVHLAEQTPQDVIAVLARLGIAGVFWRSGQTKVDGWSVTDTTLFLFKEEYQVPLIPAEWAAYMATYAEHLFPFLLVIGLASRLSALALLGMTAVIQLFVYPGNWPDHTLWAAALLFIAARGPGRWSLDAVFNMRILQHCSAKKV